MLVFKTCVIYYLFLDVFHFHLFIAVLYHVIAFQAQCLLNETMHDGVYSALNKIIDLFIKY